ARRRPLQRNGDVELAVSGASTSKSAALVALPSIVVTVIGPVVAVPGTMARTWLALPESTVPAAEPKRTAVASLRALPLMVTVVPASPAVGVKSVTVGSTRKFPHDVSVGVRMTVKRVDELPRPSLVVTVTNPVVAPSGTSTTSAVSDTDVGAVGMLLPKRTVGALPKPLPLIVTAVPRGPEGGVKSVIRGVTRKGLALSTLLAGFVMPIDPLVASSGTLARIRLDSTRVKLA